LYTSEDAVAALKQFRARAFDEPIELAPGVTAIFHRAGHILGAAGVHFTGDGRSIRFTGDLGRPNDPLMKPPEPLEPTDVLVTESTYGDRAHPSTDPHQQLGEIVRKVVARKGVVLIPAFAVGRTETILLYLSRLRRSNEIPDVPIYVNSPMAVNGTSIYRAEPEEHRLGADEVEQMYSLPVLVRTVDESKALNQRHGPMVILSASGMIAGGRILHHLLAFGGDPQNAIVLTGFQSGGTRGAALRDGARSLRIYGRDIEIKAEVFDLETLSAHADADEVLAWMRGCQHAPAMTFITHGEPAAADRLRQRIEQELRWPARVPEFMESVDPAQPRRLAAE
jgi:metallo-beta-lactamase family protein